MVYWLSFAAEGTFMGAAVVAGMSLVDVFLTLLDSGAEIPRGFLEATVLPKGLQVPEGYANRILTEAEALEARELLRRQVN